MAGSVNAIGMIVVLVGAIVVLVRFGKAPTKSWSVVCGLLWGTLGIIIGGMFTTHLCSVGRPFWQVIVPGICIMVLFPALPVKWMRWLAVTSLMILMVILGWQFVDIVHQPKFIGINHGTGRMQESTEQSNIRSIQDHYHSHIAMTPALGERSYPPGQLDQCGMLEVLDPEERADLTPALTSKKIVTAPLWHTPLTWICQRSEIPLALYYPGGTLRDGIEKLEYRPAKQTPPL